MLLIAAYIAIAVFSIAAAGGDEPPVSTGISRNPVAEENEISALRTQLAEMRRLAYSRLKVIRAQRKVLARKFAYDPGHWLEQAFLCIYTHERGRGGWATRTGNGFYGGLQMNAGFQQTYGWPFWRVLGTADLWPPSVQLAVAIRGWFDRGFHPWPNTARRCGLL